MTQPGQRPERPAEQREDDREDEDFEFKVRYHKDDASGDNDLTDGFLQMGVTADEDLTTPLASNDAANVVF